MRLAGPTDLSSRTRLRLAGLLGSLGMVVGVAADLASGYAIGATREVLTPFSVLIVENLDPFLVSKPFGQVVLGHYLALIGIPLGLVGYWHVYRAIRPASGWLPHLVWWLGAWGFVVGTVFHASFAFVIAGLQTAGAGGELTARFAVVFEPVGLLLVVVMSVALVLLGYLILAGGTWYPRWFVLFNPLVVQSATAGLALVAPEPLRIGLIVTAYNLSVLLFFLGSTVVLWEADPVQPLGPAPPPNRRSSRP